MVIRLKLACIFTKEKKKIWDNHVLWVKVTLLQFFIQIRQVSEVGSNDTKAVWVEAVGIWTKGKWGTYSETLWKRLASTVTGGIVLLPINSFSLLPNVKESVECVSIRGLESGGFVLFKGGGNGLEISKAFMLVRSKSRCT